MAICPCCCASFLERDLCCINSRFTQLIIEFTGFGGTGFFPCSCPNELGSFVIDFGLGTQEVIFCEPDPPSPEGRRFRATVFNVNGCAYDSANLLHTFSPGTAATVVQIDVEFISGGMTTWRPMFTCIFETAPSGNVCESCEAFLDRIESQTYEIGVTRGVDALGCNSVSLDWYLQ